MNNAEFLRKMAQPRGTDFLRKTAQQHEHETGHTTHMTLVPSGWVCRDCPVTDFHYDEDDYDG